MREIYNFDKFGLDEGDLIITQYPNFEKGTRSYGVALEVISLGIGVKCHKHEDTMDNLEQCLNMLETMLLLGGK